MIEWDHIAGTFDDYQAKRPGEAHPHALDWRWPKSMTGHMYVTSLDGAEFYVTDFNGAWHHIAGPYPTLEAAQAYYVLTLGL